jgi:hypothetical protein
MFLSWGWGTLHYGIRDFGSNIGLVWAKNQCEFGKIHCYIFWSV